MLWHRKVYISVYLYICTDVEIKKMSYSIYDMLAELSVEELKDIKRFVESAIKVKIEDMEESEDGDE